MIQARLHSAEANSLKARLSHTDHLRHSLNLRLAQNIPQCRVEFVISLFAGLDRGDNCTSVARSFVQSLVEENSFITILYLVNEAKLVGQSHLIA